MKKSTFRTKVLMTLVLYNFLFIAIASIFIRSIPTLLIYPPNSINTEFERHIDDGFYYDEQGIAVTILALIASNTFFLLELRKIRGWEKYVDYEIKDEKERNKFEKIKRNCYVLPSKLYLFHAFAPAIVTAVLLPLTRS